MAENKVENFQRTNEYPHSITQYSNPTIINNQSNNLASEDIRNSNCPPTIATINESWLKNIPLELRYLNQWVNWGYKMQDGRRMKIPYDPEGNGTKAMTNNPLTWTSFEQTVKTYNENHDFYNGIGFVFTEDDAYCGIDFDDCFEEVEGVRRLKPDVSYWVDRFDSYTEASPSGNGLHIIVKANLIKGGHRHAKYEIYDSGRYFTFTGIPYEDVAKPIAERQDISDEFVAKCFLNKGKIVSNCTNTRVTDENKKSISITEPLDKAFTAKNGNKIKSLYEGNITSYASPSEADMALCAMLAFYCSGEPQILDAMFRRSALYRSKWDEKHNGNGETYGEMTISNALATCNKFYNWNNKTINKQVKHYGNEVTLSSQLFDEGWERMSDVVKTETEWLLGNILAKGEITIIAGEESGGKSWLAFAFASILSRGEDLDGKVCDKTKRIFLLSCENKTSTVIKERLDLLEANQEYIFSNSKLLDLSEPKNFCALEEKIEELKPSLIIIDPVNKYFGSRIDLHRDNQVASLIGKLEELARKSNIAILLLHHITKYEKTIAGSYAFASACRLVYIAGCDPVDPENRALVLLRNGLTSKHFVPMGYELLADDGGFRWTGSSDLTIEKIRQKAYGVRNGNKTSLTKKEVCQEALLIKLGEADNRGITPQEMKLWAEELNLPRETLAKVKTDIAEYRDGLWKLKNKT